MLEEQGLADETSMQDFGMIKGADEAYAMISNLPADFSLTSLAERPKMNEILLGYIMADNNSTLTSECTTHKIPSNKPPQKTCDVTLTSEAEQPQDARARTTIVPFKRPPELTTDDAADQLLWEASNLVNNAKKLKLNTLPSAVSKLSRGQSEGDGNCPSNLFIPRTVRFTSAKKGPQIKVKAVYKHGFWMMDWSSDKRNADLTAARVLVELDKEFLKRETFWAERVQPLLDPRTDRSMAQQKFEVIREGYALAKAVVSYIKTIDFCPPCSVVYAIPFWNVGADRKSFDKEYSILCHGSKLFERHYDVVWERYQLQTNKRVDKIEADVIGIFKGARRQVSSRGNSNAVENCTSWKKSFSAQEPAAFDSEICSAPMLLSVQKSVDAGYGMCDGVVPLINDNGMGDAQGDDIISTSNDFPSFTYLAAQPGIQIDSLGEVDGSLQTHTTIQCPSNVTSNNQKAVLAQHGTPQSPIDVEAMAKTLGNIQMSDRTTCDFRSTVPQPSIIGLSIKVKNHNPLASRFASPPFTARDQDLGEMKPRPRSDLGKSMLPISDSDGNLRKAHNASDIISNTNADYTNNRAVKSSVDSNIRPEPLLVTPREYDQYRPAPTGPRIKNWGKSSTRRSKDSYRSLLKSSIPSSGSPYILISSDAIPLEDCFMDVLGKKLSKFNYQRLQRDTEGFYIEFLDEGKAIECYKLHNNLKLVDHELPYIMKMNLVLSNNTDDDQGTRSISPQNQGQRWSLQRSREPERQNEQRYQQRSSSRQKDSPKRRSRPATSHGRTQARKERRKASRMKSNGTTDRAAAPVSMG